MANGKVQRSMRTKPCTRDTGSGVSPLPPNPLPARPPCPAHPWLESRLVWRSCRAIWLSAEHQKPPLTMEGVMTWGRGGAQHAYSALILQFFFRFCALPVECQPPTGGWLQCSAHTVAAPVVVVPGAQRQHPPLFGAASILEKIGQEGPARTARRPRPAAWGPMPHACHITHLRVSD